VSTYYQLENIIQYVTNVLSILHQYAIHFLILSRQNNAHINHLASLLTNTNASNKLNSNNNNNNSNTLTSNNTIVNNNLLQLPSSTSNQIIGSLNSPRLTSINHANILSNSPQGTTILLSTYQLDPLWRPFIADANKYVSSQMMPNKAMSNNSKFA